MAAAYPGLTPALTSKVDLSSTVYAADVNDLNSEVIAIAATVGLTPQTRGSAWGVGSFATASLNYTTVGQRVLNVENGTYLVYNDYLSKTAASGNNVITPANTSTVNLSLKSASGQTADLFQALPFGAGSALASISSTGTLQAVLIDGGSA
jgi:hypothetical protein